MDDLIEDQLSEDEINARYYSESAMPSDFLNAWKAIGGRYSMLSAKIAWLLAETSMIGEKPWGARTSSEKAAVLTSVVRMSRRKP